METSAVGLCVVRDRVYIDAVGAATRVALVD